MPFPVVLSTFSLFEVFGTGQWVIDSGQLGSKMKYRSNFSLES